MTDRLSRRTFLHLGAAALTIPASYRNSAASSASNSSTRADSAGALSRGDRG